MNDRIPERIEMVRHHTNEIVGVPKTDIIRLMHAWRHRRSGAIEVSAMLQNMFERWEASGY